MSPSSSTAIDAGDDMPDIMFARRGCCFWIPCFGSNASLTTTSSSSYELISWERVQAPEKKERWWARGWKKIREWSEVVAGPKWKTFIRRFNKNRAVGIPKRGSFQYDPLSYALNFDDGTKEQKGNHEDYSYADFSARYASLPTSTKSSMDLGKDGPSFT